MILYRVLPPLLLTGLFLAGCASTKPPGGAGAQGPAAGTVTMAPIANPTAAARPSRPAKEAAEPERPASRPEPTKPEAAKPPPPPPPPPPAAKSAAADPQKAAKLRAQGLTRLNSGQVDKAVALLQQASQLDPANALIKHDLERALRISRLVHGQK